MASNSKICKLTISLSDIDQNHYDTLNLTVAQHPSETTERMMVRILVFCINARERLEFTKGLSAVDEPDIWARSLDDQLMLWIDVGEPSIDRIKKASRIAKEVKVYSFNRKSKPWKAKTGPKKGPDTSLEKMYPAPYFSLCGFRE